MKGVFGKFLDVDLSNGSLKDYEIPEEWYEKHLGGRGIAARIMLAELEGNEDPLGLGNLLIFATGPLQGTNIAGAGRHVVMAKSPKTGTVSDSYAGGYFGHELGTSGYDGIIVRGRADAPRYISLIEGEAEIHDAGDIWGMGVAKTEEVLRDEHEEGRVSSIGLAGENLVKFACIMNDRNRAAGRPGFGAVMGSKKLKAILVKGGIEKPMGDEEKLAECRSELAKKLGESSAVKWGKYGSSGVVEPLNEMGILPTKNFLEGVFDGAERIGGKRMYEEILKGRDTCAGCPIRCKRVVKTEFAGEKVEEKYGGPEYETLASFGSFCLNDDLSSIALANQKCNKYGLDTISAGNTIAFAMEASERGLIEEDLEWGDAESITEMIERIARREGLGDLLAEGIDHLAKELGADFAMEVKGQEIPMHEPRGKKALAISYAASPRGANHMEVVHDVLTKHPSELGLEGPIDRFDLDAKPRYCKVYEDLISFTNSAIVCAYTSWVAYFSGAYTYPEIRKAVEATTGLEMGLDRMMVVGERNFNLLKILSVREGVSRNQDKLPKRFEDPLPRGASSGQTIPKEELRERIDEYYEIRGWSNSGPTREKLKELDMDELVASVDCP